MKKYKQVIKNKMNRINNKYNHPLDDYHKGVYSGWVEALIWAKNIDFRKVSVDKKD